MKFPVVIMYLSYLLKNVIILHSSLKTFKTIVFIILDSVDLICFLLIIYNNIPTNLFYSCQLQVIMKEPNCPKNLECPKDLIVDDGCCKKCECEYNDFINKENVYIKLK